MSAFLHQSPPHGWRAVILLGMTSTPKHPWLLVALRGGWWLAMAGVLALALMPTAHLPTPMLDWWDKAQHALAFAVLTAWALWAWPAVVGRTLLGMLAFGGAIELAQWATGWRMGRSAGRRCRGDAGLGFGLGFSPNQKVAIRPTESKPYFWLKRLAVMLL